jgi:hypothetical protein
MRTFLLAAITSLVLTGFVSAGDIHYPDANATQGSAVALPWTSGECRYQAFVPASAFSGKKLRIVELAFAPGASGTYTSSQCEIRLAHKSTKGLGGNFQRNLEKDTTVVFSGKISWTYTANQWSDVGLTAGFNYNGVDHLVVEIRHLSARASASCRSGNVQTVFLTGTGSYNAPTAGPLGILAAPKMRFTYHETLLSATGTPSPGGRIDFDLLSTPDPGRVYQMGSSLGNGPIPIDTRKLELSPDPLLVLSVGGFLPAVFVSYAGTLDANGKAKARIDIPPLPALKGVRVYSAFVTLQASAPSGVANISNTFMFAIQ